VSPALCLNDSVGNVVLVEIEQTIQECFGILQDLLGKAPNITKLTAQSLRQHLGPSRSLVLGVPLVQRFCAAAWKLPGLLPRFPVVVNLFARRVGIIFLDLARWLVALDTGDCRQHLRIALASVETSCNQDISRYIKIYQDAIKQAKKLGKLLGRPQNTNSFRLRRKHHANGLTGQTHT
jgi:hypothetical protein